MKRLQFIHFSAIAANSLLLFCLSTASPGGGKDLLRSVDKIPQLSLVSIPDYRKLFGSPLQDLAKIPSTTNNTFPFVLSLMEKKTVRHPVVCVIDCIFWYGQHGKVGFVVVVVVLRNIKRLKGSLRQDREKGWLEAPTFQHSRKANFFP